VNDRNVAALQVARKFTQSDIDHAHLHLQQLVGFHSMSSRVPRRLPIHSGGLPRLAGAALQ